ncbi:hypothetical protein Rs2_05583 [Raphanus sativus]|nr:hypothetical protein Rs2_05583 [Raphanus sativus]
MNSPKGRTNSLNGDTKGCGRPNDTTRGPTRKQTRSVAGCDAPVQRERECYLELTTPRTRKVRYPLKNSSSLVSCFRMVDGHITKDLGNPKPATQNCGSFHFPKTRTDDAGTEEASTSFRLLSINRNEVSLAPLQTIFVDFHGQIRGDREEQVGGLQKDLSSALLCRRRDRAIGSSDYVSLLREEVEKDLTASVGKKHLLENKKRPKTVQKQIM